MDKNFFIVPDLETQEILDGKSGDTYLVFRNLNEKFKTTLKWDSFEFNDDFWKSISEKIKTLLYNRIKFEDKTYEDEADLSDFIDRNTPKYTPEEKLNLVLEYIYSKTSFDGDEINFNFKEQLEGREIWRKFYFANAGEFQFYLENLLGQGLLNFKANSKEGYHNLKLSMTGLTRIIKIMDKKNSRFCFVAMSFASSLEGAYDNGIVPALNNTGFLPFIIRKEHINSEITINDAIISGIKKAHFTIADFTEHKAGVYFEAGYALGRNQKVIYTCRKDEISKAHFDTRNYQHIVWETHEELKQKLIDKINAYILE